MNLVDIIDPEYGLQQDEWSDSRPIFGKENQLEVIGWSGKVGSKKYYILKCSKCSDDTELFGEGYFRTVKSNLIVGRISCGCSDATKWTEWQYSVLCSRKAKEMGYVFLGFKGEWKGNTTKIKMLCEKHGEWCSGNIANLISADNGCPCCKAGTITEHRTKPDDTTIASFFASGCFHPDTKFWRSGRRDLYRTVYWYMSCPECGECGESASSNLKYGKRPCGCSEQRQQQAYINWVIGKYNQAVAIKMGIATNSNRRVREQNNKSIYEIRNHSTYTFPDVSSCKAAERECKQTLECGVLSKEEMPDGYTETTSVLNLGRIKRIYEKHGGVLND